MGFPHLGVVDRWLATPKRARIALWSLSRDRRINMQLNKIKNEVTKSYFLCFYVTFNFFGHEVFCAISCPIFLFFKSFLAAIEMDLQSA